MLLMRLSYLSSSASLDLSALLAAGLSLATSAHGEKVSLSLLRSADDMLTLPRPPRHKQTLFAP